MTEPPRYPRYDVLAKRDTPSWDAVTRAVIDHRLALPAVPRFFTRAEWQAADALCRRIVPQSGEADAVSLAALLDDKLQRDEGAGYRIHAMPWMREAWRQGLAALDADAMARHGARFADLADELQDALLTAMQQGKTGDAHWPEGMSAQAFFDHRVLVDVPALYYGHPKAWSEIGFGGPASPRGYVRLEGDRRDPWEAAEAGEEGEGAARRANSRVV